MAIVTIIARTDLHSRPVIKIQRAMTYEYGVSRVNGLTTDVRVIRGYIGLPKKIQ